MWMEMTSRMVVGGGLGKDDGVDDRANYGRHWREWRLKRKTQRNATLASPRATWNRSRKQSHKKEKENDANGKNHPAAGTRVKKSCHFGNTVGPISREPRAGEEAAAARRVFRRLVVLRECFLASKFSAFFALLRFTSGGAQSARVTDASVPRRVHARWLPEA